MQALKSFVFMSGCCLLLFGCTSAESDPTKSPDTIWTIDLIHTLPGQQENYMRSIETNWANARRIARNRGAVLSYRAFAAAQDSTRDWDILLMTEYADSASWLNREPIFQAIFESDEFVAVEPAKPSNEMRTFFAGGVAMQAFVNE